jgi:small subunit ribosomal protein S9
MPPAGAAPEGAPILAMTPPPAGSRFLGTGRRKTSIARVRLMAGDGKININGRELNGFFSEIQDRDAVRAPFVVTNSTGLWNAHITVAGGGHTGQAGAIRLGIARALLKANIQFEPKLRDSGFLTRDSREVERKKYGKRKARRSFQFSKR